MAYENDFNRKAVLSAACSLTKKYRYEKYKEVWNMALDKETCDRDYLYGRLLAVADKVEQYSQYLKGENVRATNAKRYMSAFSLNPFKIWKIIEERIEPYLQSLNPKSAGYYEKLLDEIHDKFNEKDYVSNKSLNGLYLLGYHSQMMAFNKKKEENKDGE
jgi:CRISPR-associated protein Csd1